MKPYSVYATVTGFLMLAVPAISLLVTFYIYDLSPLYQMPWSGSSLPGSCIVNIHAGFDETSALLQEKFPDSRLIVLDFYDPAKHTEASILRARRVSDAFPGSQSISTAAIPLPDNSADKIFLMLSAHEIRDRDERIAFFMTLKRCLKPTGQIMVTEHLRDLPNFLAYSIGFLHFHSAAEWNRNFNAAGLRVVGKTKTTPFITTFILDKHGTAP